MLRIFVALLCTVLAAMHPYYIGVTELKFDQKSKTMDLSCKLFIDDLQNAILKSSEQKTNLTHRTELNKTLINNYLQSKIKVTVGKQPLSLKFMGWDIEEEGIWCFFEASYKGNFRSVSVCNQALYGELETQTHFLHCTVGGNTQHWKITNPDNCHTFQF